MVDLRCVQGHYPSAILCSPSDALMFGIPSILDDNDEGEEDRSSQRNSSLLIVETTLEKSDLCIS